MLSHHSRCVRTHPIEPRRPLFSEVELAAWSGFLGTFDRLNRSIEEDLQEHSHLSHVEFEVLLRLARAPDRCMRIQALADQSILTRSGMSRTVERLVQSGLVERVVAAEDRRGAYAVLTGEGHERLRSAAEAHTQLVREIFLSRFSEKELRQMADFWQRLAEGYEQETTS